MSDRNLRYGQTVFIKEFDPSGEKENSLGSICGIRQIEDDASAQRFGGVIGQAIYLIEFSDGTSREYVEDLVKVVPAQNSPETS